MLNVYRIVLAVLACVAIAVAAPQKGKMKDPRDGKTYRTMTFHKPGDASLIWMAEPLGGEDGSYMYRDVKSACPDGWRLPTLMETLFWVDVLEGEKTEVFSSLIKFSVTPQKAKKNDMLSNKSFFTSDGYQVTIFFENMDLKKNMKGEVTVLSIEESVRVMLQLRSAFEESPAEITPERVAQAVDEYKSGVYCVKRVETQKK